VLSDHLPEWLATYSNEVAAELQVPEDSVALLSLAAVSAAINGGATTMPTSTWAEPVCLYVLSLLASGEGKSPIYNKLLDPLTEAFEEVTGVHQASDARYQTLRNRMNRKFIKRTEAEAMRQVAKGAISLEEAIAEVAAAERQVALFNSTAVPLKILTDTTPAFLIDALQENNGRVVIATPEAEGLTNFRGGSKEAILKGWGAETLTKGRKSEGEVTIARPVITAMLAMQPSVLNSLGAEMVDRGLMPRFLISYPESKVGQRDSRPRLVTPEAEEAYLHEITRIVREYSDPVSKLIMWDKGAVKEIGTWRDELEPLFTAGQMLAPIAAWGSKLRGAHFVRLATILAICNGRSSVSVQDCYEAKAILRGLMIDAKRAFGEMGASFAEDDLIHLMGIVNKLPAGPFAKRDVMRRSNRFMAKGGPERCAATLDKAVEEGLIVPSGGKTGGSTWTVVE
jgi:hypothetical protein